MSSALIAAHTSTLSSAHGSEGTESGGKKNKKRPGPCARKKQFCQSELLNIAVAPCHYRSRGGALLSLTLHSHCFTTPADDSQGLDGPGWSWSAPPPLNNTPPAFFCSCLARHRLRKTTVTLPCFSRRDNLEKVFKGVGFTRHRAIGGGCGTHARTRRHRHTDTHTQLLFSEREKR